MTLVLNLLIALLGLMSAPETAFAQAVPDDGALPPGTTRVATGILDGADLEWPWALPSVGMVATVALAPVLCPRLWHHHYAKIAFMWAALTVVPMAALYDVATARAAFAHTMIGEYMSFIVLLFALYVVAGGILVTANLRGTPWTNTGILACGTLLASIIGTTGAAMILIRPLLRANANRLHNAHVVVFFIILVANVGGALSPLGDPPLFVGFLRGIDFFWPALHLWQQTAVLAGLVLVLFIALDVWYYRQDRLVTTIGEPSPPPLSFAVQGSVNLLLIAGIIGAILMSSLWSPDVALNVFGERLPLQALLRDAILILLAILSLVLTPNEHREANGFTWEPIREVAILFAAIFVCLIPVQAMLRAGADGAFSWLLGLMSDGEQPLDIAYFWVTGLLSAFLDNVPTYLVLFELAGGDAGRLMGPLASTLAAISMGAVFMGALTYIGNAPNLIVYAIAVERGVKMPSFFSYLIWASLIMLPGLALITWLFVGP
jgi:Na+/H+ antiporter NhaD/arsenite permease-like protein